MLVPFGTRVVDSDGKAVGTIRFVVLHRETRQADGLVVHQGVFRTREVVVPIDKVAAAGKTIQLSLRAHDLDTLPLFNAQPLRPIPDHWDMPVGFDDREFFLVGGPGWAEATLPLTETSLAPSGPPAYIANEDDPQDPSEPDIAAGMPVYDSQGKRVGDVESVSIDQASENITWIAVKRGHLFAKDTTIPASLIKSVTDRITLNVPSPDLRRLEPA